MRRFLQLLAVLCVAGLIAGCDGQETRLYSPPAGLSSPRPPAVKFIAPADGATFHAHANIRLAALATPYGTDLGPVEDTPKFVFSRKWELVQSPEFPYAIEFLAGTNRLDTATGGLVSARVKPVPGQATPFVMVVVGYPAIEWMWRDVPAGAYTLTARVTNDKGMVTVSTPVHITVN